MLDEQGTVSRWVSTRFVCYKSSVIGAAARASLGLQAGPGGPEKLHRESKKKWARGPAYVVRERGSSSDLAATRHQAGAQQSQACQRHRRGLGNRVGRHLRH